MGPSCVSHWQRYIVSQTVREPSWPCEYPISPSIRARLRFGRTQFIVTIPRYCAVQTRRVYASEFDSDSAPDWSHWNDCSTMSAIAQTHRYERHTRGDGTTERLDTWF